MSPTEECGTATQKRQTIYKNICCEPQNSSPAQLPCACMFVIVHVKRHLLPATIEHEPLPTEFLRLVSMDECYLFSEIQLLLSIPPKNISEKTKDHLHERQSGSSLRISSLN